MHSVATYANSTVLSILINLIVPVVILLVLGILLHISARVEVRFSIILVALQATGLPLIILLFFLEIRWLGRWLCCFHFNELAYYICKS